MTVFQLEAGMTTIGLLTRQSINVNLAVCEHLLLVEMTLSSAITVY